MLVVPEEPGTETLRGRVLKVFDGDGFMTRIAIPQRNVEFEAAIRFGFIDAPEMEQPGGHEARDFLNSLIGGQWVDLVILTKMDTGGVVDRHGRFVAVPYLQKEWFDDDILWPSKRRSWAERLFQHRCISRNIELEMVLNGWAWVLERYGPKERYFWALADAQRNRRGIWAMDDNVHPWEFKKQKYRAREQRTDAPRQAAVSSNQGKSPPAQMLVALVI